MELEADVVFKGTKDGVLVLMRDDAPYSQVRKSLARKLADADDFFEGAGVTIDVGDRTLTSEQLLDLEQLITQRHGVQLLRVTNGEAREILAVESASSRLSAVPAQKKAVGRGSQVIDYAQITKRVFSGEPRHDDGSSNQRSDQRRPRRLDRLDEQRQGELPGESGDTLLVRRTLRSGQSLRYNGNVVILGDVNPGAEVVAKGDILVMGTLRGVAHAGATGDLTAVVAAFHLQPIQLRISEHIARSPDPEEGQLAGQTLPEMALVQGDQVVIESWDKHGAPQISSTSY